MLEDNPLFDAGKGAVFTLAMPFNTSGMYRRTVDADGKITVGIYR